MKLRLILVLVLSLAVSFQGIAGVRLPMQPCPMEQEMMVLSADLQDMAAVEHDCCNDADAFAKTGKMCKPGQDCQVHIQYLSFNRISIALPSADSSHHPSLVQSVRSFDASSVWRPPTRSNS